MPKLYRANVLPAISGTPIPLALFAQGAEPPDARFRAFSSPKRGTLLIPLREGKK